MNTTTTAKKFLAVFAVVALFVGCGKSDSPKATAETPKKTMSMAERLQAEAAAEKLIEKNNEKIAEVMEQKKRLFSLEGYIKEHPEEQEKSVILHREMSEEIKFLEDDNKSLRELIGKLRRGENID